MVRALIGFNVGVEMGQIAFVAVVTPVVVWLAKPGRIPKLPDALSVVAGLAGAFWLVLSSTSRLQGRLVSPSQRQFSPAPTR